MRKVAIRVRELMRRTAGGPIIFRDVRRILQCSDTAAARVIKYLEKDGLIVSVEGSMEPSTKGNALAMATAAPPLRRATARGWPLISSSGLAISTPMIPGLIGSAGSWYSVVMFADRSVRTM